jgi:Alcohol dehydrogenase GroES-associated
MRGLVYNGPRQVSVNDVPDAKITGSACSSRPRSAAAVPVTTTER